ncbi:MAG: ABC transporter ATP-binding protein [Phormidesmis sp. CAN_BIN44]|nr:ABC transporter ATP-binding protein [Phormidesmis sp. CAN_BIN44]
MGEEIVISIKNVSKCFKRYAHPVDRLKEILLPGKSRAEEFWALRDIDLEIPRGSTFGLVGRNGSGKSTLLQIIAGTLQPTIGSVRTDGRISALLELGSGFNPEFTGRQNIYFNGRILGMSQSEIDRRIPEIEEFAEIGEFVDQPVKTYSSGMFVRLAFAVAINVNPDILIVDEALAVGDIFFQAKCLKRLKAIQAAGTTILFVSHDMSSVNSLCQAAALLQDGKVLLQGSSKDVAGVYYQTARLEFEGLTEQDSMLAQREVESKDKQPSSGLPVTQEDDTNRPGLIELRRDNRVTNGKATIRQVFLTDQRDRPTQSFQVGDWMKVVMEVEFNEDCEHVTFGLGLCDRYGRLVTGKHTFFEDTPGPIGLIVKGEIIDFCFQIQLSLPSGDYLAVMGLAENQKSSDIDYDSLDVIHDAFAIVVSGQFKNWGIAKVPGEISVNRRLSVAPSNLVA